MLCSTYDYRVSYRGRDKAAARPLPTPHSSAAGTGRRNGSQAEELVSYGPERIWLISSEAISSFTGWWRLWWAVLWKTFHFPAETIHLSTVPASVPSFFLPSFLPSLILSFLSIRTRPGHRVFLCGMLFNFFFQQQMSAAKQDRTGREPVPTACPWALKQFLKGEGHTGRYEKDGTTVGCLQNSVRERFNFV